MNNLVEYIMNFLTDDTLNTIISIVTVLAFSTSLSGIIKIYQTTKSKKEHDILIKYKENKISFKENQPPFSSKTATTSIFGWDAVDSKEITAEIFDAETRAILSSKDKQTVFYVKNPVTIIGRDSGCDVILNNHVVSRNHAKITLENTKLFLHDLGSRNGTIINDIKLIPNNSYELNDGDLIKFASEEYTITFINESKFNQTDTILRDEEDEDAAW